MPLLDLLARGCVVVVTTGCLFSLPNSSSWVVVAPVANMHQEPSEQAPVVSQAICGANLETLVERNGWLQVQSADSYTGWVSRASVRRRAGGPYGSSGGAVTVASLFANLYFEADVTTRRPLLTVPFETRLEVVEEPDGEDRRWIRVRLPDDRPAWIQRGDVDCEDRPLTAGELVVLARRFIGLPYLWGGTSTFGFDCSGFTQMLCRRRGIAIPRDAEPQANWDGMRPVSPTGLEPGDLLYFGPSDARITHTGLYLGGGEFVHATTHIRPMVQVSRLDEPHWAALLVACRRPLVGGSR